VTAPTLRSRLRLSDSVRLAGTGLGSRRGRSTLTALGIAIGIAAIVAVVGISASGRADLLATLDRLGTNLLRVAAGQGILGGPAELPDEAPLMAARIAPVEAVTATALIEASVRRTDRIPELETGGIAVIAVEPELARVLGATLLDGRFLDAGSAALPAAVLGRVAAERLGFADLSSERLVTIGGDTFTVVGILDDLELHPDIERAALVGYPVAGRLFGESAVTTIYLRVRPEAADDVVAVLPTTINPENPDRVEITRPSDALAAREAADAALTQLLVALGSVALLVGGVAIANIMVMSVLERRMEIGVRRALGATRAHIRRQFLLEAMLLAGIGGLAGVGLGAAITAAFARVRDLPLSLPVEALAGAVAVALAIGALAGLYPAIRAARIPPSEAVRGSQ
jgi:putative ABC transport system permease protein